MSTTGPTDPHPDAGLPGHQAPPPPADGYTPLGRPIPYGWPVPSASPSPAGPPAPAGYPQPGRPVPSAQPPAGYPLDVAYGRPYPGAVPGPVPPAPPAAAPPLDPLSVISAGAALLALVLLAACPFVLDAWLLWGVVPAVGALATGICSVVRIRRQELGGLGWAVAGLVVGGVLAGIVLVILAMALFLRWIVSGAY